MKVTTLEDVMNARRIMDHAALALTEEFFQLAKTEYVMKLKLYSDETTAKDAFKLFYDSEKKRIEQISLLDRAGSNNVSNGTNKTLRPGSTIDRI